MTVPNGFYLVQRFGTGQITGKWTTFNFGTKLTQPSYVMNFEYDYYPTDYTITYNLDGGTNSSSNPDSYTVLYGVTFSNPTKAGYDFVRFSEIDFGKIPRQTAEDVVLMMIDEGKVLRINEEMFTMKHLMDEAKEKIQNHLKEENLITIAQVRDMFATSRKSAKPILEYMDSIKVTKKTGAESERVAY